MREFVSGPPRYQLAIKGVREQFVILDQNRVSFVLLSVFTTENEIAVFNFFWMPSSCLALMFSSVQLCWVLYNVLSANTLYRVCILQNKHCRVPLHRSVASHNYVQIHIWRRESRDIRLCVWATLNCQNTRPRSQDSAQGWIWEVASCSAICYWKGCSGLSFSAEFATWCKQWPECDRLDLGLQIGAACAFWWSVLNGWVRWL